MLEVGVFLDKAGTTLGLIVGVYRVIGQGVGKYCFRVGCCSHLTNLTPSPLLV